MDVSNWLLTILIGALLSIPIGIATNLFTPKLVEILNRSAKASHNKKLATLKKEYEFIQRLHDNEKLFLHTAARDFVLVFLSLMTLTAIGLVILAFQLGKEVTLQYENILLLMQLVFGILASLALSVGLYLMNGLYNITAQGHE